jgi:hypothetical protein
MTIDWKDKAVQDRLLTAVIASMDNKVRMSGCLLSRLLLNYYQVNIAEIARLYGQDMTYYALENYLRKVRKDAKDMKIAAADRDLPAPSPARPRTKKASSVSPVKAGRSHNPFLSQTLAN